MVKRLNDFLSLLDLCRYSRGRESLQLPKTPGGCGQIHSSEFLTVYEDRWIFCPQWGAGNFWTILYACIFWLEKHTCHVPPWPIWPLGGLWPIQSPSNFTLINVVCECFDPERGACSAPFGGANIKLPKLKISHCEKVKIDWRITSKKILNQDEWRILFQFQLRHYLSHDHLKTDTEEEIFDAVLDWCKRHDDLDKFPSLAELIR